MVRKQKLLALHSHCYTSPLQFTEEKNSQVHFFLERSRDIKSNWVAFEIWSHPYFYSGQKFVMILLHIHHHLTLYIWSYLCMLKHTHEDMQTILIQRCDTFECLAHAKTSNFTDSLNWKLRWVSIKISLTLQVISRKEHRIFLARSHSMKYNALFLSAIFHNIP